MGLGCSVQVVQEAAAAEGGPACSQGCLTPDVVLLPFLLNHVHWGQSGGRGGTGKGRGERDPVRGQYEQQHPVLIELSTQSVETCWLSPSLSRLLLHQGGSHAYLVHWSSPMPVSGTPFLECVNKGDICSATVRPLFLATSPSLKPKPAPFLMFDQ